MCAVVWRGGSIVLTNFSSLDLHNPSASTANKLGYPLPIISHSEARERALRRYKNPGEE